MPSPGSHLSTVGFACIISLNPRLYVLARSTNVSSYIASISNVSPYTCFEDSYKKKVDECKLLRAKRKNNTIALLMYIVKF